MKQSIRVPLIALAALLAVALFPFGWLTEVWPAFDQLMGFLFASEAAHAVGHSVIFALVGSALLVAFPALRRRPGLYLLVILAIGIGQEAFQLLYKGRPVALNDVTDLGTDLVAAGVVWALWYIGLREKAPQIGGHHAQTPGRRG
jgi:hypothetical protein